MMALKFARSGQTEEKPMESSALYQHGQQQYIMLVRNFQPPALKA